MDNDMSSVQLGPRRCSHCGSLLVLDAIYCHRCGTKQPAPTLTLYLTDHDDATIVLDDPTKVYVVGRTIEPLDHFVDVDLGPYRGKEQGVSRSHAQFSFDNENYLWQLTDIGSQYGTFIGEVQLVADDTPTVLETHQELRFGGIQMRVAIVY